MLGSKLHTCEVTSIWYVPDKEGSLAGHHLNTIYPDLQFVGEHNTGESQRAIYYKQISSTGVKLPSPSDASCDSPGNLTAANSLTVNIADATMYACCKLFITILMLTSDKGSDQTKSGKITDYDCAELLLFWFIHSFCEAHQSHLSAKRVIALMGNLWGNLAKMNHLSRSTGVWKNFKQFFCDRGRPNVCKRLPNRPLRGRWNSTWECLVWWLLAGPADASEFLQAC